MQLIFTLAEINKAAAEVWQQNKTNKVWALHGSMGSGKTTFVHALCQKVLQVTDVISSPTFALINEYQSPVAGIVFHMDWYRLKDEAEALQAGMEDSLYNGDLCLIEWPEKAPLLLPEDTLHLYIETIDSNTRRLYTQT